MCGINIHLCYNTDSYFTYTIAKRRDDMIPPIYHGLQKEKARSHLKNSPSHAGSSSNSTRAFFPRRTKKHGKTKTKKTQIELGAVCSANYVFFAQKEYGIVFVLDQREKHIFSWGRQKMAKHAFVFLFFAEGPQRTCF